MQHERGLTATRAEPGREAAAELAGVHGNECDPEGDQEERGELLGRGRPAPAVGDRREEAEVVGDRQVEVRVGFEELVVGPCERGQHRDQRSERDSGHACRHHTAAREPRPHAPEHHQPQQQRRDEQQRQEVLLVALAHAGLGERGERQQQPDGADRADHESEQRRREREPPAAPEHERQQDAEQQDQRLREEQARRRLEDREARVELAGVERVGGPLDVEEREGAVERQRRREIEVAARPQIGEPVDVAGARHRQAVLSAELPERAEALLVVDADRQHDERHRDEHRGGVSHA